MFLTKMKMIEHLLSVPSFLCYLCTSSLCHLSFYCDGCGWLDLLIGLRREALVIRVLPSLGPMDQDLSSELRESNAYHPHEVQCSG